MLQGRTEALLMLITQNISSIELYIGEAFLDGGEQKKQLTAGGHTQVLQGRQQQLQFHNSKDRTQTQQRTAAMASYGRAHPGAPGAASKSQTKRRSLAAHTD